MNSHIDEESSKGFNDKLQEVLPRRAVLRNALAVGCGLLLPAALIGCDSKNSASPTPAAPADTPKPSAATSPSTTNNTGANTTPSTTTNAAQPAAPQKLAQSAVQFQPQPKNGQQCSTCQHFVAESKTCALVEGHIPPEAWCILWVQTA